MTTPDSSAMAQEVQDKVPEPAIVKRNRTARIFGFKEPTESGLRLAKILVLLIPVFSLSFQISTTFYMIFIAETLGGGDYIAGLWLHLSFTWSNLSYWSTFCKERV